MKQVMKPEELSSFIKRHTLSTAGFAEIIGVTPLAVDHWLHGRRRIPPTTAKVIRFFDKEPEAMEEF